MDRELLARMESFAREAYVPIIREDSRGVLLRTLRRFGPRRILEIGTAIGYSAVLMMSELPAAELIGLELLHCRYAQAAANLAEAGYSDRATVVCCDAADWLASCNKTFDFVFLDGPKGQYARYLPQIERLLAVGGVLFADNLHYGGRVARVRQAGLGAIPRKHRAAVKGLIAFTDAISSAPWETEFDESGDGIAVSVKR